MLAKRLNLLRAYKTETTPARVKLSSNELPYDLPEELRKKIDRELKKIPFNRYPDPHARELKEVLADFLGVPAENIMLGNGSDELIYYLSAVVGEQEEGVYIPAPTFPMYEISAKVFGRRVIQVLLDDSFDIDLEESLKSIEVNRVRIAYYAYPNNPTGNLFSRYKMEKIRNLGLFSVMDEAYYHYCGDTFVEDALNRDDTVVLRTLSKIGLASLRVGVLIGKEEVISELEKIRLPFNISYTSQVIAKVVLTEGKYFIDRSVNAVVAERERLYRELRGFKGVEVFPSRANFLLFRTPFEGKKLHRELLSRGVLVRDMSFLPRLKNCLRVSVGTPQENDAFLEALYNSLQILSTRSEKST